jgi:hypothetical protein
MSDLFKSGKFRGSVAAAGVRSGDSSGASYSNM